MKEWTALLLLGVCLLAMALPAMDAHAPRAIVTGPAACALCGVIPAYCTQCWVYLLLDIWNYDTMVTQ